MACGYVCAIGDVPWTADDMRGEVPGFSRAYAANLRHFKADNHGGNGLFHSFLLWFIVRHLRPSAIVESGVHLGWTSRLLRLASEAWQPLAGQETSCAGSSVLTPGVFSTYGVTR